MKTRKIVTTLCLFLLSLILIGCVSAADNVTDEVIAAGDDGSVEDISLEVFQNYTPSEVHMGEYITICVGITNVGITEYTNLPILYRMPEGLDTIIWPSEYDRETWLIDSLHPGETDTLTLICQPLVSNTTLTTNVYINGKWMDSMDIYIAPSADLAINVDTYEDSEGCVWFIDVINNGPDWALNTNVYNLPKYIDYLLSQGYLAGDIWKVGNLAKGENATLMLLSEVYDSDYNMLVLSDIYDQNLTNNWASGSTEGREAESSVSKTVDSNATGNPIAVLLLGLMAIPFAGFRRN